MYHRYPSVTTSTNNEPVAQAHNLVSNDRQLNIHTAAEGGEISSSSYQITFKEYGIQLFVCASLPAVVHNAQHMCTCQTYSFRGVAFLFTCHACRNSAITA
jgi:hypothetical protein